MSRRSAPDLAEPIVGLRAWHFGPGEPVLSSLGHGRRWPAREPLAAVCYVLPSPMRSDFADFEPHPAPRRDCSCGIYALKEAEHVDELLRGGRSRWSWAMPVRREVTGEVALWGTVVEHEAGYRAELAYPLRIVVPDRFRIYLEEPGERVVRRVFAREAARLIAELYGVETVVA
jgi:hypothetical protein